MADTSLGALAPSTPAQLKATAQQTIQSAYAPAQADLQQQTQRIQNIEAKRASDNKYYLDWVQQQTAAASNAAAASNQAVWNQLQQNQQAMSQARQQVLGSVQHVTGSLAQQGLAGQAAEAGNMVRLAPGVTSSQVDQANNAARNQAFGAMETAKQQAETLDQLSQVSQAGTKMHLQMAADQQRLVANLLSNEINKAKTLGTLKLQSGALGVKMGQLGVAQQRASTDATYKAAIAAARTQGAQTAADRASVDKGYKQGLLELRQKGLDIAAGKSPGAKLAVTRMGMMSRAIGKARGLMGSYVDANGKPTIAGMPGAVKVDDNWLKSHLLESIQDPNLADAAFEILHGGHVSAATQATLKSSLHGVQLPAQWRALSPAAAATNAVQNIFGGA